MKDFVYIPIYTAKKLSASKMADAELQPSSVRGGEDFTATLN